MSQLVSSSDNVPHQTSVEPDVSLSVSGEFPAEETNKAQNDEGKVQEEVWQAPKTLFSTMWNITAWYTEQPFLGRLVGDHYEYLTYAEVWTRTSHLGAGLLQLGLQPKQHYAICGINTPEWAIADFVAALWSFVTIPLVVTLDDETLIYCLNLGEIRAVLVSQAKLDQFVRVAPKVPLMKTLIVMDPDNPQFVERNDLGIRIVSMKFAEGLGERNFTPYPEDDPDALWSIVYTSGSTGMPKGAMMSRNRWNTFVTNGYLMPKVTRLFSFAPLAHVSERQTLYICGFYGGCLGSYSGDMGKIFDEIQLLKPTYLSCPPRLYNQIYAEYKAAVDKRVVVEGETERWKIERELLEPFKKLLGGEIEYLVTGSAPTSNAVKSFLERCYQITVYDGYGTTEAGGISTDNVISGDVDVKLIPVPDLNYFPTDKPYPRGEICVKTKHMISGYWKNEEKTKESFVDGYFRTGDVGELRHRNEVYIIDRVKNIFKLAQGEFVAPAKVEMVMLKSKLIDQICVCGNPLASSVVAVVYPNVSVLLEAMKEHSSAKSLTELFSDPAEKELAERLILADFSRLALRASLQGYEIPSRLVLFDQEMTAGNNLLTASMKLKRGPIHKRFAKELDALWDNPLNETDNRDEGPSLSNMLAEVLNIPEAALDSKTSFLSAGGDSLSAVKLASKIREQFNKDVPLSLILKNPSLDSLKAYIDGDQSEELSLPAAASADLLMNAHCLGPATEPARSFSRAKKILLTGATGFLGAFTLRSLIKRQNHPEVVCVVRGAHARERLLDSLKSKSIALTDQELERVVVLSGDISQGLLGQSVKEYNRLCREIDAVVHCAATVNWMVSYESMRDINVLPILDLVRLCSTHSVKTLVHVSTITCAPTRATGDPDRPWEEYEGFMASEEWARGLGPYGLSKYVAERLLIATAKENIPWICLRPAFIGADRITGCGNATDFVHRYIRDCISLGCFIESDAIRNWTPVDFVVDAMLALCSAKDPWHKAFHATNNQSPSYSELGSALQKFGYQLKGVTYEEFREMLLKYENSSELLLYGLLPMFTADSRWLFDRASDISNCEEAGIQSCQAVAEKDFNRWLSHLVQGGFLPSPNK